MTVPGQAGEWRVPTAAGLLSLAIDRLGGETKEVRVRIDNVTRAHLGSRVVATMPDPEAAMLVCALAESLGATLERPKGTTVSFWLPIQFGGFPGPLTPPMPWLN